MIISVEHTFTCADDDEASMTVNISEHDFLYFDSVDWDGERAPVHMRDREQVILLRDMLTLWLSHW